MEANRVRGYIIKIICVFIVVSFPMATVMGGTTVFPTSSPTPNSSFFQIYDYVIITTDELENAVTRLVDWKESLGYLVKVVTTTWISSNYQGSDIQEKIRNFLIDKHEQWGITYVLIMGSRDTIPMRTCYPLSIQHENEQYQIPTDYYYADLTGDWDFDRDGYFGEYRQDNVDFYPEVYVGRIPCDNVDTVEKVCHNIQSFESDSGMWKKNVLLLGAIVFYENQETEFGVWHRSDSATLMEACRNDVFEPCGFTCTRMYETEGIRPSIYDYEYKLNRSNVLSKWTQRYGIVNMLGHASNTRITRLVWDHDDGDDIPEYPGELQYVDFLRYSDSDELSVETPPIVYTSGCHQLHTSRNMGRAFIEDGAAVAFIGSTDMSWYNISMVWNDEGDGGCMSMDYYFFFHFINYNQKCGNALYNSKAYFYNRFKFTENDPEWIFRFYGNLYGFNLYGDPSLGLTTEKLDSTPPIATLEKPQGFLYVLDKEIAPTPLGNAVIIGGITVNAIARDDDSGIEKIEIWVDNKIKFSRKDEPFEWLWDETIFGRHELKVVVYDIAGNIAGDEIGVRIFNI